MEIILLIKYYFSHLSIFMAFLVVNPVALFLVPCFINNNDITLYYTNIRSVFSNTAESAIQEMKGDR